jgi:hypothetical protein
MLRYAQHDKIAASNGKKRNLEIAKKKAPDGKKGAPG